MASDGADDGTRPAAGARARRSARRSGGDESAARRVLELRAPDLDRLHDPGYEVALERAAAVELAAVEPITTPGGGEIRLGTSSWTDPTMTAGGVFYPSGADTAEERLAFYASRFPVVEVDATYYALPSRRTAELWVERTPPDFTFDVKAHALMTGQPTEPRRLPRVLRDALPVELAEKPRIYAKDLPDELRDEVWSAFADGLGPLKDAGQLGAVFLQYPRWFFTSSENRDAIREAHARLTEVGLRAAIELRNASWFNEKNLDRTMRFLADEGLPLVLVDAPQGYRSSVPPIVATTSPELSVVRFHGRRGDTWERSGVTPVERFRYLYDRDELGAWVPRIREAASSARETHVLMNNCYANYGSTNALELAALLADLTAS
jgi:uncharacterized protein YecE (DUF72 family)